MDLSGQLSFEPEQNNLPNFKIQYMFIILMSACRFSLSDN